MKKLLVVDDDDLVRETLTDILCASNFEVHPERNAEDALKWLSKNNCDAVVTDVIMPDMDGIEFIGKVRATGKALKIVAISGGSEILQKDFVLTSAKYLGADDVLSKPIENALLIKRIRALVG